MSEAPDGSVPPNQGSSLVLVAYGIDHVDLTWVDGDAPIVVVRNDERLMLSAEDAARVELVTPTANVGFGAGVNLAAVRLRTSRLVVVNPDAQLQPDHWRALSEGSPSEIVTVPLVDGRGRPEVTAAPYPNPVSLLVMALRLGRFAPRGGRARRVAARVLRSSPAEPAHGQRHPLTERWASGAVLSIDVGRFRAVGGFDEAYFLYFEDVDLCERLGRSFPDMTVRVADVEPAIHEVGGSGDDATAAHRARSAARYARGHRGRAWSLAATLLARRPVTR